VMDETCKNLLPAHPTNTDCLSYKTNKGII
jgi:hypothetical protein